MKVLTVRMTDKEHEAIKQAAWKDKTTMNQLIRDIMKDYILREQNA